MAHHHIHIPASGKGKSGETEPTSFQDMICLLLVTFTHMLHYKGDWEIYLVILRGHESSKYKDLCFVTKEGDN